MDVSVFVYDHGIVEKASGKSTKTWQSHRLDPLPPPPDSGPENMFQRTIDLVGEYLVKVPIGSNLETVSTKHETWLMLRVNDRDRFHAADVLRMARNGERGFSLKTAQIPQTADA